MEFILRSQQKNFQNRQYSPFSSFLYENYNLLNLDVILTDRFLNNYLGKYLEDLNTDHLSIALSQGTIHFHFLKTHPFCVRVD
jgi:hypothetical protein